MSSLGARYPQEQPENPYVYLSFIGAMFKNFGSRFCPGCGYGIIGQSLVRLFEDEKFDQRDYPLIIGIGCYTQMLEILHYKAQNVATLHGRAPAIATGIKLANPKLKPIILSGDGDGLGIGGNHFMHICRRNLDCVILIFNNSIYGMTGGQVAPTTPVGAYSTTTPYQVFERQIDTCKIALAAGATYVARTTVTHPRTFRKYLRQALAHKGTSVIEVITPCVTYFGRINVDAEGHKMDTGGKLVEWIKDHCVRLNQAKFLPEEDLRGKFVLGEFKLDEETPEYSAEYQKVIARAQSSKEGPE
ncbi:MAG TPA: thiamine pyrophosphate-dependent enzyme [Candidatus Lokiarchaeia archaeon]|nr:thiamine pyrophosphate-dependent enzyme [Candidatus Lokiarchaeia archaeon]